MSTVLITGAGRGFGRQLAEQFLSRGWTVFPLIRNQESLAEWKEKEHCHPIVADVSTAQVEDAIVSGLEGKSHSLDVLINNAGEIKKLRGLRVTRCEDINRLFAVHCLGAFRCTMAALPFLRQSHNPVVVNISSRFGSITNMAAGEFRGIYSYSIAKSAQNMLTVCLDQELRPEGIRVVALHPGRLTTSLAAAVADTDPSVAAERFFNSLSRLDRQRKCTFFDLMEDGTLPW